VVTFTPPTAGTSSGCVSALPPALTSEIASNPAAFYINIHSTEYPGGAVRGQLGLGPADAGATRLLPTPLRAYDSRASTAGILAADSTRVVSLFTGKDNAGGVHLAVPPGATGAIVTLTVTDTLGAGFLKLYSAASPQPATSSINWYASNAIVAVSTTVAVDAFERVAVTSGVNATHFVIDVIGFTF
jgi:hypothetical protein